MLAELKKLADDPASRRRAEARQAAVLADAIFGRESVHGLADSIARGVTTTDLD